MKQGADTLKRVHFELGVKTLSLYLMMRTWTARWMQRYL